MMLKIFVIALLCFASFAACQSREQASENSAPANLVIINSPVAGTVRRVFARERMTIEKDEPLFEIAVDVALPSPPSSSSSDSHAELERARQIEQQRATQVQDAKERAAVEVARVEALVREGSVPQSQLDAARAEYQRAQQQSQNAPVAMTPFATPTPAAPENIEQTIIVRATHAGSLRVISVRARDRVNANQSVATIAVDE